MPLRPLHYLSAGPGTFLAYLLAARLSLLLAPPEASIALFWPAAGISAGTYLITSGRTRRTAIAAVALATLCANLIAAVPLGRSLIYAVANTGEALLITGLLEARFPRPFRLDRFSRVINFLGAATFAAAVSGLSVAATLRLFDAAGPGVPTLAVSWFTSDLTGIATVAPLILVWAGRMGRSAEPRRLESAVALALMTALACWIHFQEPASSWTALTPLAPILPLLVWIAARAPAPAAAAAPAILAVILVTSTILGRGPFSNPAYPLVARVIGAQALLLGVAMLTLVISVLMERGRQAAAVLASISDGFLTVDSSWRITSLNRRGREILAPLTGPDGDVRGRSLWDVFPDIVGSDFERAYRESVRTNQPQSASGFFPPLGSWFDVRCYPFAGGLAIYFLDVGDRVRTEQALHASRADLAARLAELEALYAEAPLGLAFLDREFRFIRINAALAEINGFPAEAHIGRRAWDLLPDVREEAEPALRHVLETGEPLRDVPITGMTAAQPGVIRHWTEQFYPLKDSTGAVIGIGVVCEEITERKKMAAALEASEAEARSTAQEFQTLADNIPTLCWMARPDGEIYWYNRRWFDYTGTMPADMVDNGWRALHDPQVLPLVEERWRQSIETGEPFEMTFPLRGADGTFRLFLTRITPVRNAEGAIIRWFGANTDVDALNRTEAERRRLASVLEKTPDFVGIADPTGKVVYINPAGLRMTGLPPDADVRGLSVMDFHPPEMQAQLRQIGLPGTQRDGFWEGETVVLRRGAAPIPVSQVIIAHRDSNGLIEFYSTVARDISERKTAEERERLLAKEVDHRAKNLLAVVQSVVQLTRAEGLDALKTAITGRIASLGRTHSLIAASRWEGADIRQLFLDELSPHSHRAQLRVEGPSLMARPAAAQSLALAVHELVTNAVKYGALSTPHGRLDMAWALETIADDERRLRIRWQERGGPPVTAPSRTGFGSQLIRTSIERQLKGRLDLDWQPSGLVCRMDLPAATTLADPLALPSLPQEKPATPPAPHVAGARRVLVLEDEPLIAMQIEAALSEAGYAVLGPAARLTEADALLSAGPVDIALLDVNVDGERSFDLADRLLARRCPVVFCTGYAGVSELPERFGPVPTIMKPFTSPELLELLATLDPSEPQLLS